MPEEDFEIFLSLLSRLLRLDPRRSPRSRMSCGTIWKNGWRI